METVEASPPREPRSIFSSNDQGYTCFPWIFNPGCYLNGVVNWCLVCRTNTLGWEQCDVDKQNEVKCKEYSSFFNFEKEASLNDTNIFNTL
jgi:hypothetical protein